MSKKFKVTYVVAGSSRTFEVDSNDRPSGGTGEPGSVLDMAMALDVDIDHACGGVSACSTCHVVVRQGLQSCNESSDSEEDQLDKAPGLTPQSRLACQCIPSGDTDLVVEVPSWNRNLVREGAHD